MSEEEFNRLYALYHDLLYHVALSRIHHEFDVENILQNVFLALYLHHPVFENELHERKWLLHVCINACRDYHKSYWNKHISYLDEAFMRSYPAPSLPVLSCMKLSPLDHAILTLYYDQGYPIRDIAAICHMSLANVKVRKKKALLSLKQQLCM